MAIMRSVQGHSQSPLTVLVKSPYVTSYQWVMLTYTLSCTISKILHSTGQAFCCWLPLCVLV